MMTGYVQLIGAGHAGSVAEPKPEELKLFGDPGARTENKFK